jgi:hypothetical protein
MSHLVVIFEPHRDGEPELNLADQVQAVIGPFEDSEDAQNWIDAWQTAGGENTNFEYLITNLQGRDLE